MNQTASVINVSKSRHLTEADNEGTERIFILLVMDKNGTKHKYPEGDNHFTEEELYDAMDRIPADARGAQVHMLRYQDVSAPMAERYSRRIIPAGNGHAH